MRAGGAILGESKNALELREGSYDPVIYFPRADIAMAVLDRTDKTSQCPHKGQANYFSIQTALLHKASDVRGSPFPRQTYPTASVTGMPSAV